VFDELLYRPNNIKVADIKVRQTLPKYYA